MTIRALCMAGALTLGLSSGAVAQSLYIDTPVGGVGVGAAPYADSWGPRGYYGAPAYYGPRGYYGAQAYDGGWRGSYAYSEFGTPDYYGPAPGNLHMADPRANPNVRPGMSLADQDYNNHLSGGQDGQ